MTSLNEAAERVKRAATAHKSAAEKLAQAEELRSGLEWLATSLYNELREAERALRSLAMEAE